MALLAGCALAVAGCGGGNQADGATSDGDRESENRKSMLAHAQCMREHGVDMPDPVFDGGGVRQKGPDEGVSRAKLEDAEQACRKLLKDIEPPKLSDEEQEEFKQAALANSRCMREHGVENFPDPTFGADGRASVRIRKGSGPDPDDPAFEKAQEACKDTLPEREGVDAVRPARVAVAGTVAVAAVAGAVVLADGGDDAGAVRAATPTATATVERRDLTDRESVDGTLGYADVVRAQGRGRRHADGDP